MLAKNEITAGSQWQRFEQSPVSWCWRSHLNAQCVSARDGKAVAQVLQDT